MSYSREVNLARTDDSLFFSYDPTAYEEFAIEDKEFKVTVSPKVTTKVRSPYSGPDNKEDKDNSSSAFIEFKEDSINISGVSDRLNIYSKVKNVYLTNQESTVEIFNDKESMKDISLTMEKDKFIFSLKEDQEMSNTFLGSTACETCGKTIPRSRMGQDIHNYDYH